MLQTRKLPSLVLQAVRLPESRKEVLRIGDAQDRIAQKAIQEPDGAVARVLGPIGWGRQPPRWAAVHHPEGLERRDRRSPHSHLRIQPGP
jgi:hypothetical protein